MGFKNFFINRNNLKKRVEKLEKRVEELSKGPNTKEGDTISTSQILDEWLNGKEGENG